MRYKLIFYIFIFRIEIALLMWTLSCLYAINSWVPFIKAKVGGKLFCFF